MAYIYGSAAQGSIRSRRKDILLRLALPLLFVLALAGVALYAFRQEQYWLTALFAVFFVASILRFEELGLTISHYLSHSQTNARAGQVVSKALEHLPSEYHVFHDLNFDGGHIDHAVIGPNGLFLIRTSSHLGNISASGESLRLNGWPFLLDMLTGCWNQTQKLTKHLDLQYSGGLRPCPVLCFSRASVGIMGPVRGALVVEAGNLVQAILNHEDALLSDKMYQLVDKFAELVSVKTKNPVCSTDESKTPAGQPFPAKSNLPICAKCEHHATLQEFELFPGECPKCGRLYSFVPDESEDAPEAQRRKSAWRPTIPQLAMTVLLIAGCAGFLAYRHAFLTAFEFPVTNTSQTPPVTATTEPVASTASVPTQEQPGSQSTQPMSQAQAADDTPRADARPEGSGEPLASEAQTGPPAFALAEEAENSTVIAIAPDNATSHDGDSRNSTLGEKEGRTDSKTTSSDKTAAEASNAPDSFVQGILSVTASRPLTLWLRHQQTYKEFGPYEIGAGRVSEIRLPKGFYNVVYLENGRRRQTTMSFLSDRGRLDF